MKKLLSILLMVIYLLSNLNFTVVASESDKNEDIEPNIYEKKEIQIQQKGLDKNKQIKEIPLEQKKISFEKTESLEKEQFFDSLFQSSTIKKNTITEMADRLQLFSRTDSLEQGAFEKKEAPQRSNLLQYIMILVAVVAIGILIFVFPKIIKEGNA